MRELPNTMGEMFTFLDEVAKRIATRRKAFENDFPDCPRDDYRHYWYIIISKSFQTYQLQLYLGRNVLEGTKFLDTLASKSLASHERLDVVKNYDTDLRVNMELRIFSVTESFFRSLYIELTKTRTVSAFKLFDFVTKLDVELEDYSALFKIHRLARNSVHSYGVFWPTNMQNEEVEWRNKRYVFEVGKQIEVVAGHDFLIHLVDQYLSIVDILVRTDAVRNIEFLPSTNWEKHLTE